MLIVQELMKSLDEQSKNNEKCKCVRCEKKHFVPCDSRQRENRQSVGPHRAISRQTGLQMSRPAPRNISSDAAAHFRAISRPTGSHISRTAPHPRPSHCLPHSIGKYSDKSARSPEGSAILSVCTKPEEDVYVMVLQNRQGLCEDLKSIFTLKDICDVTFLVGENRKPIQGIRAIIASRSK